MVNNLKDFFLMGGHGLYVWSAYGSVVTYLAMQWFLVRNKHE
jgi:heme exporter protein CcmD